MTSQPSSCFREHRSTEVLMPLVPKRAFPSSSSQPHRTVAGNERTLFVLMESNTKVLLPMPPQTHITVYMPVVSSSNMGNICGQNCFSVNTCASSPPPTLTVCHVPSKSALGTILSLRINSLASVYKRLSGEYEK